MQFSQPQSKKYLVSGSPITNLYDSLLTLIYPQACQICGNSVEMHADGYVCRNCWERTHVFGGGEILCHKCGAFLKTGISDFKTFCHRCDGDFFDAARAVGTYDKALLVSVLNLKHTPFIPQRLKKLFAAAFLNADFRDMSRIIPVPLSEKRFSERGFNQASLLGKFLAGQISVKFDEISLRRKIHTEKHRAGMDRKTRVESVKNAFEVTAPRLIENERILLVDDVFTSGATVSSCAKVLKEKGAEKVYVLTIAHAV